MENAFYPFQMTCSTVRAVRQFLKILLVGVRWNKGRYGFLLPPEQIEPCSEEVINSYIAMGRELRNPTGP